MTFTKGHTLWNHPNCKKSQFKHGEARHSVPHSVEAKLKMSESRKGKAVGSANPSWKGGVTPLLIKLKRLTEYKTWQKGVFARDNYTCRSCSIRGCKTLTAHHLVSFSFIVQMFKVRSVYEAREQIMLWNIRNGVTLCEECHKQTANYAWRANKKPRDRAIYKIALLFVIFFIPTFSQAATFGYTTIGASSISVTADQIHSTQSVALTELGYVEEVTYYSKTDTGVSNKSTKSAIYRVSDNLLLAEGSNTFVSGDTPQWYTSRIPVTRLDIDNYYVGFAFDAAFFGSGGTVFYYYDTVASANRVGEVITYPTIPSTATPVASTRQLSVYATYYLREATLRINTGTIRINNGTLDL